MEKKKQYNVRANGEESAIIEAKAKEAKMSVNRYFILMATKGTYTIK